jgi:hypothetical protein
VIRLLRKKPHLKLKSRKEKEKELVAQPRGVKQARAAAPVNVARGAIAVFLENHGEMTVNVKSGNGPFKE